MKERTVPVVGRLAAAVALVVGCSDAGRPRGADDGGPGEDASAWVPEIAEPGPPAPPVPPTPPELPRMTPCPDGWREEVDPDNAAVVTCDPWPEGGRQECAEDEAHFPGRPGCERIGPACPEGEWPAELPEDARVVYVRAGEPEGGDGTRERPYGWIADAVAAANDGDVIALSKGLFDEEVRIDRAVRLLGACVLETRIAPSAPGAQPAAVTLRAAAVVRDLQVGGAEVGVDVSRTDGTAELHSVLVREATVAGVSVRVRGALRATELVVRDTASDEWGAFGLGVELTDGAQVTLERAVLERNRGVGLQAYEAGTAVTGTDLVVRDTLAQAGDGNGGWGLEATSGAQVTLERVVLERNHTLGVLLHGDGTTLAAADIVVSDTSPHETDDSGGYGLEVVSGADVRLLRAVLQRNRTVGLLAGAGTVRADDLVVSDTEAQESDGTDGYGLEAAIGAVVALDRAVLERNRSSGMWVTDEGTVVTAADLVISGTRAQESDGAFGYGLEVTLAAEVTLERAAFGENRTVGVGLAHEGTTLMATDVVVSNTQAQESDGTGGYGLAIISGAQVSLERASFERNREVGVALKAEGSTLTAADLLISDTQPQESDGGGGYGLQLQGGAVATIERAIFRRNRGMGALVGNQGSALTASDLVVSDTLSQDSDGRFGLAFGAVDGGTALITRSRMLDNHAYALRAAGRGTTVAAVDLVVERASEQACAIDSCSDATGGFGIASEDSAALDVRRFRSADNALVGVLVASGAELDLHEGVVSGNRIGANVQVGEYDLARLQDEVIYADNAVNSDTTRMALPGPLEMLDFDLEDR
ncbi:MAG: hypothetical protein HYY06_07215 [Deltaproteobacteria bacterium]|nr:hypothetical protein [Deltaproteobacteria bacterium]